MTEVAVPYDGQEQDRGSWCGAHIGRQARHGQHVGELYPWYPSKRFGHTVYVFAREQDAFLFKLRWL